MFKLHHQNCCEDTAKLQHDYYVNQAGRGLPHFTGGEYQRGHGLGTVISGLRSNIAPLLNHPLVAKAVKSLKRKAMTTGFEVASDVMSGKKLKTSINERVFQRKAGKKPATQKMTRKNATKKIAKRKSVISAPAKRQSTSRYNNTIFQ